MKIFKAKIKDPYKTVIYNKKNHQLFNIGELVIFNNILHNVTNVTIIEPEDKRFFINIYYYDIVNRLTNEKYNNISQLNLYKNK